MLESILIRICGALMALEYAMVKIIPVKKGKVLFLSRQTNEPSCDFLLLQEELQKREETTEIVTICQRFVRTGKGIRATMGAVARSIWHLASSDVCIVDSYWPAVSMLHHRDELTVIQIWHSLGKIKQSGLATVGRPGGRPVEIVRAGHMHKGYDFIVAGAPTWNRYYCESFGCPEDKLLNLGLPRMDFIRDSAGETKKRLFNKYPQMKGKPVVVYAPTFRRYSLGHTATVDISGLQDESYFLVAKCHPNQLINSHGVEACKGFSTLELLSVADVLITDYSAVSLEAAWAHVKILYYLYDYDAYREQNGLNVDPYDEMPSCVFTTTQGIVDATKRALAGDYSIEELERFRSKWLLPENSHPTIDLADFICSKLNCDEG